MQCAGANGIVVRDDLVMLAANLGRHADVGTFLAGDRVAENRSALTRVSADTSRGNFIGAGI